MLCLIKGGTLAGARLILWEKKTDERGNLRELVIWKVKETAANPEGVRYRLALIRKGEKSSDSALRQPSS
jgi:hypothetical protein